MNNSELSPVLLSKVETILSRSFLCGSSSLPTVEYVCGELRGSGIVVDDAVIGNVGEVLARYQVRLEEEFRVMQGDASRVLRVRDFGKIKTELWEEYTKLKEVGLGENDVHVRTRISVLKVLGGILEAEGRALGDIKGSGDGGARFAAYVNSNTFISGSKEKVISLDGLFKGLEEEVKRKIVLAITRQESEVVETESEVIEDGQKGEISGDSGRDN